MDIYAILYLTVAECASRIQSKRETNQKQIYNHQTQTPLHTPARFCWKDPDTAVSCEAMPGPRKHRSGCYWMDHRAPNRGARESSQGAKGICNPIGGTTIWTTQYSPELVSRAADVSEDGLVGHQWKERPNGRANFICLSTGERQGQEMGVGG